MQVLKVDPENPSPVVIEKAAKILQLGGLVAYPTETLYGLGANVMDMGAIQKVFETKGRAENKPVSIAFRDLEHARRFAVFNGDAVKLAELFLPGPLTMILPSKVPLGEMFGEEKIAVRVPDHEVPLEILRAVRFPITATSANISGKADPISAQDVIEQIGEKLDLVIDAGNCKYSRPSTLVDMTGGKVEIVREGAIPKSRIIKFLESSE